MELHEIKEVVAAQKEEFEEKFEKEKIIEREIDKKRLLPYLKHPNILAILGIRRCGKSVLAYQIFQGERFGYINFDDERLSEIEARDLDKVLQAFYELYGKIDKIILDEPQNIPKWELFANRLRRTKKVIITGSNSQLLSGELATKLTGRHIDFTLFPFSFREFLSYMDFKLEKYLTSLKAAEIKNMLREYLFQGGLPESYKIGREITVRIYSDIVQKDIVRRLNVKKRAALKEFIKYLISNSAREFSFRRISKILDIKDVHTVKNWFEAVENAYLGFALHRFSPKLKEQIIAPKKFYTIDNGMITSVAFRISSDTGRLMENLVAVELLRRKSYWYNDWEIYYWKDYQQREVDFVIKEGLKVKSLVQITFASGKDEIEHRELKALLRASDLLKCKDLLVITWDYEDVEKAGGKEVKFVPLWKWLLTP